MLDIKNHNIRKLTVLILGASVIAIVGVFVYPFNLAFGQEEQRYQNATSRIISLHPVNPLSDIIKESFTEEFESMLTKVGN